MSNNPVSTPIGVAPLLQNFNPVHSFGLCEAVITIPGRFSIPDNE